MNDFTFNMALVFALIPVVQGVVEALKLTGLPSKFAPLSAIALGVGGVYLTQSFNGNVGMLVLTGVVVGLGAAGLYSFTKSNLERKFNEELEAADNVESPVSGIGAGGEAKTIIPTSKDKDKVQYE